MTVRIYITNTDVWYTYLYTLGLGIYFAEKWHFVLFLFWKISNLVEKAIYLQFVQLVGKIKTNDWQWGST